MELIQNNNLTEGTSDKTGRCSKEGQKISMRMAFNKSLRPCIKVSKEKTRLTLVILA